LLPQRKKKTGKYFAQKVEYDGIKFDSKLEAARYKILKAKEENGEIENVEVQVPYECMVEGKKICKYIADFRYWCKDQYVVEDTKGVLTQVFSLKKKLVEALHPGVIVQIIKDPREWPPRTVLDPHPSHVLLRTQHQTCSEYSEPHQSLDQDQSWS
jgi:hypothetical protein